MSPSASPDPLPSRRDALRRTLAGLGVGLTTGLSGTPGHAGTSPAPAEPAPFRPEHDYPFFGAEPPEDREPTR